MPEIESSVPCTDGKKKHSNVKQKGTTSNPEYGDKDDDSNRTKTRWYCLDCGNNFYR